MLVTWPAARGRRFDEIDSDRQRVLLERLALHMQLGRGGIRDGDVLVRRTDLERSLANLMSERFSELDPIDAAARGKRWLRWLEASSGLLVEQQPGRCGFVHLSIMEYLAGRAVLRETSAGGIDAVAELVVMRHEDAAWYMTSTQVTLVALRRHLGRDRRWVQRDPGRLRRPRGRDRRGADAADLDAEARTGVIIAVAGSLAGMAGGRIIAALRERPGRWPLVFFVVESTGTALLLSVL
jgi:hypothetical protein